MNEVDFAERARAAGAVIEPGQAAAFREYRDRIVDAATRFNLTAVRDPVEIERRHFLEALALGALLRESGVLHEDTRMIDIGSGAGFPGLPLKIAWPSLHLTLLDVSVLEGRAEELGREAGHRDAYELAVARAVAPLPVLLEYALPFVRPGGWLAAQKGTAAPREVEEAAGALRELRAKVGSVVLLRPPGGREQSVVLVRKLAPTPERYPRRPGVPARRPLA
jgi:16S rRNA (guanine527-N7)-methyltransferase